MLRYRMAELWFDYEVDSKLKYWYHYYNVDIISLQY